MRRQSVKAIVILVLLASVVSISWWWFGDNSSQTASAEDYSIDSSSLTGMLRSYKNGSYAEYMAKYLHADRPETETVIEAENYSSVQGMNISILDNYQGEKGKAILTQDTGSIQWEINVEQAGLYNIKMKYYTAKGKDSDIERELRIDGSLPFSESRSITFNRIWTNEKNQFARDERGNDLIPLQVELPMWQENILKDMTGFYEDPYLFYFSQGKHTLSLTSVKEPLVIDYLKLIKSGNTPSYVTLANKYSQQGYKPVPNALIQVEGENALYKGSPTLLPYSDHSSPALVPYDVSKLRNNAIGGYAWRMPGQWIEWEIGVPEDGLYQIAVKNRQNYLRGMSALRTMYIDDEIPFQEMKQVQFPFNSSWQMKIMGKDAQHPYLFYLKKGTHRIRFEVTLGDLAPILRAVQSSILDLNAMYRKIISFTGTVPDTFRDYQLEKRIPEMTAEFHKQSDLMYKIALSIEGPSRTSNERSAMLNTLAYQLKDMALRPETVPSRIDQFKTNVGGLGSWLLSINEQPLSIDNLIVSTPAAKLPKAEATQWQKLKNATMAFASSFFVNYDEFSSTKGAAKSVDVWVTSARDQAQVIKRLVDDRFTVKTGIHVNLKLVGGDVLLPATVAGKGPDVALQVGNELPVNYGSRNALQDLSVFADFDQVKSRFSNSAMVPYTFNGKYYALPEQITFPVLFYRKDILEDELKLKAPQTWDEVYAMLPMLQKHNLQFGLPQKPLNVFGNDMVTTDIITLPPSPTFAMFLYQHDGQFYQNGGQSSGMDSEASIQEFKRWTDFYVNYKIPITTDFANRFRTGEMPIGISDYTMYNKLSVFAPEIKGLWEFIPVPGVKTADGSIRREVGSGGSSVVMFKHTKNKDASWEFMKWWTSKETQLAYGRQMEVRIGASARYPTANLEALSELPWPTRDFKILKEQMQWVRGIPEVPGGYLTGRHMDNAFRKVVIQGDDPRETMDYYVRYINDEITLKRKEFNLPYDK